MGAIFGFYIVFAEVLKKAIRYGMIKTGLAQYERLTRWGNVLITFGFVCIGWVFFRATSLGEAWYILTHLTQGLGHFITHVGSYYTWKNLFSLHGVLPKEDVYIALLSIVVLVGFDLVERNGSFWNKLQAYPASVRWGVYYAIVLCILAFGSFGEQQFIYFQF
jgi:phosphatidylglycerophosphate synthase